MAAMRVLQLGLTVDVPGFGGPGTVIEPKGGAIEFHPDGLGDTVRITRVAGGTEVWLIPVRNVAWMKIG
ncbi:MAG TPA: hypothetical protein VGG39_02695 [Polyangiaceae bacterium]|jgi:hypothetical protein